MNVLTVKNVSTAYGKKQVLDNISLEAKEGEILGILGENGSGKSTLIKSICNIKSHKGSCYYRDEQLEKLSTKRLANYCSYVPQKSGLELEMTVLEVVLMGFNPKLSLLANPSKEMLAKAKKMLEGIGFKDKVEADYMSLSEGQKQLCILVRALVSDSKLLLMDEPENALDVRMRHSMMTRVREWVEADIRSVIVALHDIELALNYCDRLVLIKDGRIAGIIKPKSDALEDMEDKLANVYGKVSLRQVMDNSSKTHLVMLKEDI